MHRVTLPASDRRRIVRRVLHLILLALAPAVVAESAFADATYQSLPFTQTWTNTGLISTDDDWSGIPGVVGFRGDGLTAVAGVDPQTVVGNDSPGVVDLNANQTTPNTYINGGVTEFHLADPVVALLGSATADAPYLVLHIDATRFRDVQVAYKLRDVESSVDNSVQQFALQFRTSAASSWTNVPAGYVADASAGPSLTTETNVSATLPVAANFAATLQIRIITTNANSSDEWIGIDDIVVNGTYEPFSDVTTPLLANSSGFGIGAAWGDFDGDGDLDLYQTGISNRLFRNDAGVWVDGTTGVLGAASDHHAATAADSDNDGDLDLFVADDLGSASSLFRNDGGSWTDATNGAMAGISSTQNAVWADFDRDGTLELFLARSSAGCLLLRNDSGTWTNATSGPLGAIVLRSHVTAADFDNDGDTDLFLTSEGGPDNRMFRNDSGAWVDVTAPPLNTIGDSHNANAGDFDNDGDLDLYVTTEAGQPNRLLRNDLGSWTDVTSGALGETAACLSSTAGDFDNDGDLDIYLTRAFGFTNRLLRNDGGTWVVASGQIHGDTGPASGTGCGDYDGDGDLDIFLANKGAANRLFRNETSNGNHWLHVNLVGTVSNRSGIGARVRVVAGGVTRIREVEALSGRYGQNSLTAEFGFGTTAAIDSVVVRWPSGSVQIVFPAPAIDQVITVTETVPLVFFDVAAGALAGAARGAAWVDVDGDDDLDLYLANSGGTQNVLARNDSGTWVDATAGALANTGSAAHTAVAGDADNDGDPDFYVSNINSANVLVRNDGESWVDATSGPLGDTEIGSSTVWGDFDNDGDLDLYLVNFGVGYLNRLFRNDAGTWVDATSGPIGDALSSTGAVAADFDNDNDLDLYVTNSGGTNKLYRNNGGTWTTVSSSALASPVNSSAASAGDYDNDGDLDLYVTTFTSAEPNKLLRNDGATWADVTTGPLGDMQVCRTGAWGDFDNDGDLDLFVTRPGPTNLMLRNDSGTWVSVSLGATGESGTTYGAAWGDADDDGDIDLFVAKLAGGNRLFRNDHADGNHWLHVDLVGTVSNRSAIGARVRVVVGGVARMQEISGGSGYSSQNSLTAEFGLGAATAVDSVVVRWPNGTIQVVAPVPAVDQRITVVEPVPSPPAFTNVASGLLADTGPTTSVAWGDVDGDSDLDLFFGNAPGSNRLLRNDGGAWSDLTTIDIADPGSHARGGVFADYDNDGDLDLYFVNDGQSGRMLRNDAGTWLPQFNDATQPLAARNVVWADFDLDADLDLFVTSSNAPNRLYMNEAGTLFNWGVGLGGSSLGAAAGDYDDDGDLDLYVVNNAGPATLFRNDGDEVWNDVTPPILAQTPAFGPLWADLDNDSDLDLFVSAGSAGQSRMYRNDGGGAFVQLAGGATALTQVRGATAGDYDNDGDLDLFLARYNTAADVLCRNDGGVWVNATESNMSDTAPGNGTAWADYDGDGDLDLYVANENAPNRLYRNELANGNHWLQVKLVGTASNRSAVGARVRVIAGGVTRMREISAGTGYVSATPLLAEFGLGAATAVDSLVVRWPSGIVQAVIPPAVDQRIVVAEAAVIPASFTDVTSAPLDDAGTSTGTAWADVDGDGDLDLFLASWGYNNLFRNDGGIWTDVTSGALVNIDSNDSPAFADFDGDGDLDLYLSKGGLQSFEGEPNQLLRNDAGTWVDATSGPLGDAGVGRGVAWGDIENDGDLDLFVANRFSSNKLFRNDAGTWVDATTGPLVTTSGGHSGVFGDYDGDGDLDLAVVQFIGSNKLLRNDAGSWTDVTTPPFASGGTGAAWADSDNDGDLDLYISRGVATASRLLRNDAGTFVNATTGPLSGLDGAQSPGWADYDNDGDLDLLVAGYSGNALYRNDGTGWTNVAPALLAGAVDGQTAAWGDYDLDGDLDFYLARFDQPNLLLRNDEASGNHWLHARLVGTASNRSAIGARMTVVAGGVRRMLEVATCTGLQAGNSLDLEFGLGASTTIDSVIIRWPGGTVWDTTGVAADQRLTLIEHSSTVAVEDVAALPRTLELSGGAPNPFGRRTRLDYALPAAGRAKITVHDLQGRAVATLADHVHPPGRHSVIWEGDVDRGGRAGPGVYFVRLEAAGHRILVRKVVMTR